MSSPSSLGDLGYRIASVAASSSTAAFIDIQGATDTGTVVTSGRALDLSKPIGYTTTGGLPLDATVNPESRIQRQFRSVGIMINPELRFDTSGTSVHFLATHQHRSATSGAGSTWATIATETKRYKMGTDTDGVYHVGFTSTVNAQAVKRYYKAIITTKRRLATDSGAQDTTTESEVVVVGPAYVFGGAQDFPAQS